MGPQSMVSAYRDNSAAATRDDPADGQGPASWTGSGISPKPDVPVLLVLAGTEP